MILRVYLFSLYLIIFLSFGLFCLILFNVNPYQSPFWMIIVFYLTFFLFWLGIFGLIGYYLKIWASNREVIFAHLLPTLRQGAVFSLFLVSILFLLQVKALNWWVGALLLGAFIMIELSFKRR